MRHILCLLLFAAALAASSALGPAPSAPVLAPDTPDTLCARAAALVDDIDRMRRDEDFVPLLPVADAVEKLLADPALAADSLADWHDGLLVRTLAARAEAYDHMGNRAAYNQTVKRMETVAQRTHSNEVRLTYYTRMAHFHSARANNLMARHFATKALSLRDSVPPEEANEITAVYHSLMRELSYRDARYAEAVEHGKASIANFEKLYPQGNINRYVPYLIQAMSYAKLGDTAHTQACLDSVARIYAPGKENYQLNCYVFTIRAQCYQEIGLYRQAIDAYAKADSVLAEMKEKGDVMRLSAAWGIASAYGQLDQHEEAVARYDELEPMVRGKYGDTSGRYATILVQKASSLGYLGRTKEGEQLYTHGAEIIINNMRRQLPITTTLERDACWQDLSRQLWAMTGYAVKAGDTTGPFVTACYNTLLFSKSLIYEVERNLAEVVRQYGTYADRADYDRLTGLLARIKTMERDYAANAAAIDSAYVQAAQIDKKLTTHMGQYRESTAFLYINSDDVRARLGEGDLLIDFQDYMTQSTRSYAAYLTTPREPTPVIVPLFTQAELDSILGGAPMDALYEGACAEAMQHMLWQKIAPWATPGGRIYYVPSGMLYQVALESLLMADGSLLGDHYQFRRLSSARELCKPAAPRTAARTAVLYGALQYDATASEMAEASEKYKVSDLLAFRSGAQGDGSFPPLPETRREIDDAAGVLRAAGWHTDTYSGLDGTEESLLALSERAPGLLHIATHGFYYTPDQAQKYDYLRGLDDAMSLSGLAMAGANIAWRGDDVPPGALDGILTARHIARLDLTGTDLVILSACQTAQGKITEEGLYGLPRAFKKAGARTLVMTLWRVSDVVAQQFMDKFYDAMITRGLDKHDAFAEAKAAIRARYPEPFYWTSFVMVD